jgi:hypothetical protein
VSARSQSPFLFTIINTCTRSLFILLTQNGGFEFLNVILSTAWIENKKNLAFVGRLSLLHSFIEIFILTLLRNLSD